MAKTAVMELRTLPLGFRFHPTDEELVTHYLKGKITGQINSEAEVIPEIDVCKCEPWDLPDKSIIQSDDPEWFFFAPKDRKYPNGSRSNRATEAGYWKATGKDRIIKSKGDKRKQHTIGMKKTLVFHRGRAPKGERTGWIMHEYRTTEPEFESGEQGGYVLYRLFRKQEEKTERPSPEEVDRSGYSPTPSRSSPDNLEANEEANTPLKKESPESGLHDPIELPNSVETPAGTVTRWLADRNDNLVAAAQDISHIPFHGHAAAVPKVDPSAGASAHFVNPQNGNDDYNKFVSDFPPILPLENAFFGDIQQGAFGFDGIMNPPDALDVFLNQTLVDPDEHSSTTSKVQYDSDIPTEIENHWNMQVEPQDDQSWWANIGFETEPNPLLPYDVTDQDVLSVDSGADSFNELFNSMEDPNVGMTGITLRPQQLDSTVQPSQVLASQGDAFRRLRLVECKETITKDESEDEVSCIVTPDCLNESVEDSTAEKDVPSDGDEAESTGIIIRSRHPALSSSSESLFTQQGTAMRRVRLQLGLNKGPSPSSEDSSSCIIDESESQHKAEKAEIEEDASTDLAGSVDDLPGNSHDDEQKNIPEHGAETTVLEAKSVLRLRKTSEESNKDVKQEDCLKPQLRAPMQTGGFQSYVIWLVVLVALLLLLCVGAYGWV